VDSRWFVTQTTQECGLLSVDNIKVHTQLAPTFVRNRCFILVSWVVTRLFLRLGRKKTWSERR